MRRWWLSVLLLGAPAARADEFRWVNVNRFPDDLLTTEDGWTAARAEDANFISYRIAADDFTLDRRTRLEELAFYSVEVGGPEILGGDWYVYEYDDRADLPGALIAGAAGLTMGHEDTGLNNVHFGTVYFNTLDLNGLELEPGRYFVAFRSWLTFKNTDGKHGILTTRYANGFSRALWNFDVLTDGAVGGPWVTMDQFNQVIDQEWAFQLLGQTEGTSCTGREKLKSKCKNKGCGERIQAKLKRALPGAQVTFELDGQFPISQTVDAAGQAAAVWCPAGPGNHHVEVRPCGVTDEAACP